MNPSREILIFILQREALVLTAYQDGWHDKARTVPKYSIGVGTSDPSLKPGDTITIEEALRRFKVGVTERARYISRLLKVPVTQNQFDALLSLYYQGGNLKLKPVIALINAGDVEEAGRLFTRQSMGTDEHGHPSPGLFKRRAKERLVFDHGYYGDLKEPVKLYRGPPRTTKPEEYVVRDRDFRAEDWS